MSSVKRVALAILVLVLALAAHTTTISAAGCGLDPVEIKPLIPVGCKDLKHACVCSSSNNCYWAWVCVKR